MSLTVSEISPPQKRATQHSNKVAEGELIARFADPEKSNTIILHTKGLSPCICIVFYGTYKGKTFSAMLHWSGFRANETADDFDASYFGEWTCQITEQLDAILTDDTSDEDETLSINQMAVVGGQSKEVNDRGELLCSGTASEIMTLYRFLSTHKNYTDKDYDYHFDENLILMFKNFMSKNEESISVYASRSDDIFWCFENPHQQYSLFKSKNSASKRKGNKLESTIERKKSKVETLEDPHSSRGLVVSV